MSKLSGKQLEQAKEAQQEAKLLIADKKRFDKAFEETFKKDDTNKDGTIDLKEYISFLQNMLQSMGRKNYNLPTTMLNFDRADKDKDGQIDKEEFKKEFLKRMKEFADAKL